MTFTKTGKAFDRPDEAQDVFDRLKAEGKFAEAVRSLIECGQEGLAYREIIDLSRSEDISVEQKVEIVGEFAKHVDVEHAARLASHWRISRMLPQEVLDMFRRNGR